MDRKIDLPPEMAPVDVVAEAAEPLLKPQIKPPDVDVFMGAKPPELTVALTHPPLARETTAPIDIATLRRMSMAAQFKDFYDGGEGHIIAVEKSRSTTSAATGAGDHKPSASGLEKEFGYYKMLQRLGISTPDPEIVPVQQGDEVIPGMRMKFLPGTSIDLHKDLSQDIVSRILAASLLTPEQASAREIDLAGLNKEATLPLAMRTLSARFSDKDIDEDKRYALAQSLGQIVNATRKGYFVNDLQGIVGPDGKLTVIDPLFVGTRDEMSDAEWRSVDATYRKVSEILRSLVSSMTPANQKRIMAEFKRASTAEA